MARTVPHITGDEMFNSSGYFHYRRIFLIFEDFPTLFFTKTQNVKSVKWLFQQKAKHSHRVFYHYKYLVSRLNQISMSSDRSWFVTATTSIDPASSSYASCSSLSYLFDYLTRMNE